MAYEIEPPESVEGVPVRQPVDFLDPVQLDAVHLSVLDWLGRLPSTQLKSGQALANWRPGWGEAPVWSWLGPLGPYIQICLRTIRLARAVVQAEAPVAWALLGTGPDAGWQAPIISQVMGLSVPSAIHWIDEPRGRPIAATERAGRQIGSWLRLLPLWLLRRTQRYRGALARLSWMEAEAQRRIPAPEGHAVLISRGQRGTHWLQSRSRGRPILIDEYSEGMPDALVEACVKANWRLTLIWESSRPTVDGIGYADRWPDHVTELTLGETSLLAAAVRPAARARYVWAIRHLVKNPGFRAAFRLEGVDVFSPFADFFTAILIDHSVLMATQTEAWRQTFKRLEPNVVTGGRLESRPWINVAAAETGARTASVKLGIGDEMTLSLMAIRPDGLHETGSSPDALLLWGDHQVEHIRRRLPQGAFDLQPVGRTRSDTFVNEAVLDGADIDSIRATLGLKKSGPVIVWSGTARSRWGLWPGQTSGSSVMAPESWRACLIELCRVAADMGGQVLVKPHPADDMAFVDREVARMDQDVCVLTRNDTGLHNQQLLTVTDVVVSSVSSMFAEAVLAGKVAVNVWTADIGMIYEQDRFRLYSEIASPARSAAEAGEAVRRLLSDPEAYLAEQVRAKDAMKRFFGPVDGRNAERAAEWVIAFGGGQKASSPS